MVPPSVLIKNGMGGRRFARSFSWSAATERLVNPMPDKAQPGRAIGSCLGSIVLREHPADDVFIDLDAKGVCNLLSDAGTANAGVAAFDLDDRVDEFLGRPVRAGTPMTS